MQNMNTTENLISTGCPATAAQPMVATKRHKNSFVVGVSSAQEKKMAQTMAGKPLGRRQLENCPKTGTAILRR
jgi:hypothetical protein